MTDSSTTDRAKSAAQDVAGDAQSAAASVAGTAKDEVLSVKDDAVEQGLTLVREARGTLGTQASEQVSRFNAALRSLSDDLERLSRGEQVEPGLATELAGQATARAGAVADWFEGKEPADLLEDVKSFARRRPLAFLGLAAGIGLIAGRLTRSTAENRTSLGSSDDGPSTDAAQAPAHLAAPSAAGAPSAGAPGVSHTGTTPGLPPVPPAPPMPTGQGAPTAQGTSSSQGTTTTGTAHTQGAQR